MSESAWLVCDTRRTILGLGKAVKNEDGSINYFHDGSSNAPNSRKPELTKALWKFIADYHSYGFRVVTEYSRDFGLVSEYSMIDGDTVNDITLPDYLRGWQG